MSIAVIAKKAGVSKATVSRVLNGSPKISEETTKKVLQIAQSVKYKLPSIRRFDSNGIKSLPGRTGTVGVLWVDMNPLLTQHVFFASLFSELTRALAAYDMRLSIIDVKDSEIPINQLSPNNIDGLIILGPQLSPDLVLKIRTLPAVRLFTLDADTLDWSDSVMLDEERIGIMAARYFISKGIKNTAFLNARPSHDAFVARGKAFCEEMARNGSTAKMMIGSRMENPSYWPVSTLSSETAILVDKMLSEGPMPAGIFVPADDAAAVLHNILLQKGIKVGKDVLIFCCNNEEAFLGPLTPRPASIDINKKTVAIEAVNRLMIRIKNNDHSVGVKILIPPAGVVTGDEGGAGTVKS